MRLWATRSKEAYEPESDFVCLWASKPVRDVNYVESFHWAKNEKCKCKILCPFIPVKTFKKEAGRLPSFSSPMLVDVRIRPVVVAKKPSKPRAKKA